MKILVDADACPVVPIIIRVAKEFNIPVTLFCDTNHIMKSDYAQIRIIGAGADAVDIALINTCSRNDIVVTQDYGLAAMVLSKKAYAIHQSGRWYTSDNIDTLLAERHMAKKARMSKAKHHLKGPRKRTTEDDRRFEESFRRLVSLHVIPKCCAAF